VDATRDEGEANSGDAAPQHAQSDNREAADVSATTPAVSHGGKALLPPRTTSKAAAPKPSKLRPEPQARPREVDPHAGAASGKVLPPPPSRPAPPPSRPPPTPSNAASAVPRVPPPAQEKRPASEGVSASHQPPKGLPPGARPLSGLVSPSGSSEALRPPETHGAGFPLPGPPMSAPPSLAPPAGPPPSGAPPAGPPPSGAPPAGPPPSGAPPAGPPPSGAPPAGAPPSGAPPSEAAAPTLRRAPQPPIQAATIDFAQDVYDTPRSGPAFAGDGQGRLEDPSQTLDLPPPPSELITSPSSPPPPAEEGAGLGPPPSMLAPPPPPSEVPQPPPPQPPSAGDVAQPQRAAARPTGPKPSARPRAIPRSATISHAAPASTPSPRARSETGAPVQLSTPPAKAPRRGTTTTSSSGGGASQPPAPASATPAPKPRPKPRPRAKTTGVRPDSQSHA